MATIPTIPGFTVGQLLGAASLQSLADMATFLSAKSGGWFQAHQSVAQSIANATDVAITFPTEDVDTDGGHSTSSNTSRYTAQTSGQYWVSGAYHSTGAATDYGAWIRKNGTGGAFAYSRCARPSSGDCYLPVGPVLVPMTTGDYVEPCQS